MTPDPYRAALETAIEELTEITAKLQQLQARQGQVHNLVTTLQKYFGDEPAKMAAASMAAPASTAEPVIEPVSEVAEEPNTAEYTYLQVPAPLPEGDGDAFQRRVKTTFRFKGLVNQN